MASYDFGLGESEISLRADFGGRRHAVNEASPSKYRQQSQLKRVKS